MGIPWNGMGWDRHELLWNGMDGTEKYVPWTSPKFSQLKVNSKMQDIKRVLGLNCK